MIKRAFAFPENLRHSAFLWGPRQTGKSTLLDAAFPEARRYDLLRSDEYRRLSAHPGLIREECEAAGLEGRSQKSPIVIDEIQKVPDLLDEVHWLMEKRRLRFILCGSSSRRLRRGGVNLLGGRAVRFRLHPFVSREIRDFSLERALNHGLLPRHYLEDEPRPLLEAYIGDYMREEVAAEALTRNVPAFARFLEAAALSNGQIVNHGNIARECGISSPTVKSHFQILVDTLLGGYVPAFTERAKRRVILAPKFYFFDVGVVGALTRRGKVEKGSELFGRAFEHYLYQEIAAHADYSGLGYPIAYWRTASGFEVDFILGGGDVAVEVKGTPLARTEHMKGLRAFREDHGARRAILVTLDKEPRKTEDGIEVLPWKVFLEWLWDGDLIR